MQRRDRTEGGCGLKVGWGGAITERISGGEMKDSRYLLLIKARMRDRELRGKEGWRGG